MKRRGPTPRQPWEPFTERVLSAGQVARVAAEGWPPGTYSVWRNNRYQVWLRRMRIPADAPMMAGWPIVHLSIKRTDKGVVRDWRHLQRIKNELVGYEHEAVELFPADSRLLDEANQYHLWVFAEPGVRFPFGSPHRIVGGPEQAAAEGARQRPFDP